MTKIASSSRRVSVYTSRKYLFTCILAVLSLLGIGGGVKAQSYYVFYNSTYGYVYNDSGTPACTTTFTPACVWVASGELNENNYRNIYSYTDPSVYFNGSSDGTFSLGSSQTSWRIKHSILSYRESSNYYLKYNGSFYIQTNYSSGSTFTPYIVTINTAELTSTNPTIDGDDVIALGEYTYTANGAAYQVGGYNTYTANGITCSDSYSPANISSYAWSISPNLSGVALDNGVVTVSSLPENNTQVTLTVTATVESGSGNPAAPSGVTLVGTKTITIGGYVTTAPTISRSGNEVTLSADAGATIYYTTDGSDPTTSDTRIEYTGSFTLSEGNTTIRATATRDGSHYYSSTQTYTYQVDMPVITINNSNGSTTITCGTEGATIYYTIDGTNPTTGSTPYSNAFTVSSGTEVRAIAVKANCTNSDVATALYATTGVIGTVVTLNDYEDHNWSYYLPQLPSPDDAVDNPICSPYPRNVCIKYYGNGTGTVATTSDDEPTTFGADAEDVQVGIDAAANTFVYYKTLERYSTDIGRYEYTTIPNPFSVRPTYGSGDSRWRGFYKWRVKSITGGAIYTTADGSTTVEVGGTIDAEDVLYFQPTDNNYTNANNATSMTVELEALWAQAYVSVGTSGLSDYVTGTNAYERNFHVVSSSTASNFQKSYPCTVSGLYPNGTTDGGTTLATNVPSTYIYNNFTAAADTKFEYLTMYNYGNNDVYTANNHYLILGRGLSPYNNYGCATTIRGMSGESSDDLDYTIRVESGVYANYYQVYNGGNSQTDFDGLVTTRGVFGCDYDRAAEDNDNLEITAELYGGKVLRFTSSSNKSHLTFDYLVKSGNFQENVMTADINGEGGTQTFYLGSSQSASGNLQYIGLRRMTIEGGIMAGIAGGMNNASTTYTNSTDDVVVIRMKGGTISGSIYGAASFAWAVGIRKMIFTGGTVNGWIAGGCNGYTTGSGGTLTGDTKIYVGGTCQVVHTANDYKVGTSYGGNIFGAGSGYSADYEIGQVENSTIVIADECEVSRNVYGGGNYGYNNSGKTASVYVLGGQVDGAVFGGANQRYGQTTVVKMYDGWVKEGVYGGSNVEGTINNTTTVSVYGGTVGAEGDSANVHGGGLGSSTYVAQDVTVTIGEDCDNGPMIYGDVHGGSAQGTVNGTSSTSSATSYPTNVTVVGGTMNNVYGGGLGTNSIEANVWGPVTVSVTGGTINNVFGGNNVNGTPQSTISVTVNDACATEPTCSTETPTYTINGVFGGGNAANYDGTPTVTISDGAIKEVYGGGNAAEVASTSVSMTGGFVGTLYGGGKGASAVVNGTSTVNMTGGTAIGVFGGGNAGPIGTSSTDPNSTVISTVTVNNATVCTNVFGGGNAAVVKGSTQVNVIGSSTVGNNVYGGGNAGDVKGNTNVVIGDECTTN